jgi:hypothetical protein
VDAPDAYPAQVSVRNPLWFWSLLPCVAHREFVDVRAPVATDAQHLRGSRVLFDLSRAATVEVVNPTTEAAGGHLPGMIWEDSCGHPWYIAARLDGGWTLLRVARGA